MNGRLRALGVVSLGLFVLALGLAGSGLAAPPTPSPQPLSPPQGRGVGVRGEEVSTAVKPWLLRSISRAMNDSGPIPISAGERL